MTWSRFNMTWENYIVKYVFNKTGKKIGTIVGFTTQDVPGMEDQICIGFSLCSLKFDDFNKEIGKNIARERGVKWAKRELYKTSGPSKNCDTASKERYIYTKKYFQTLDKDYSDSITDPEKIVFVHQSVLKELKKFIPRCKLYFKNKQLPKWAEALIKP